MTFSIEGVEFPRIERALPCPSTEFNILLFPPGILTSQRSFSFCNIFVRDKTKFVIEKCQIIGKRINLIDVSSLVWKKIVEVEGADDTPPRISPNFKLAAEANLKI